MQFLKIAALLTAALGCILAGGFFGAKNKRALGDLETVRRLIGHIKRAIVYDRAELPYCFSSFFEDEPETSRHFAVGDYASALSHFDLETGIKKELLMFFEKLGSGTAEEEEKRCERILDLLDSSLEKRKKELPGKMKSSLTLGICAAAVLLLLFL